MSPKKPRSLDPTAGVDHWHDTLLSKLDGESDRAVVIMAAAMLEDAVGHLLRERLVLPGDGPDPLFDVPYAPASTFRAKIELGYRVGVLSELQRDCLDKIRDIRNSFAHDVLGCSFNDQSVVDRVANIARLQGIVAAAPQSRAAFRSGTRGDFEMTVSYMLWMLASHFGTQERIAKNPSFDAHDLR